MNTEGVGRSSDHAINLTRLLSWSPVYLCSGRVETGMQSVTKEQRNRAEQKTQAHTAMDLAVAGAVAQGSTNYGLRANLVPTCFCISFELRIVVIFFNGWGEKEIMFCDTQK